MCGVSNMEYSHQNESYEVCGHNMYLITKEILSLLASRCYEASSLEKCNQNGFNFSLVDEGGIDFLIALPRR